MLPPIRLRLALRRDYLRHRLTSSNSAKQKIGVKIKIISTPIRFFQAFLFLNFFVRDVCRTYSER